MYILHPSQRRDARLCSEVVIVLHVMAPFEREMARAEDASSNSRNFATGRFPPRLSHASLQPLFALSRRDLVCSAICPQRGKAFDALATDDVE